MRRHLCLCCHYDCCPCDDGVITIADVQVSLPFFEMGVSLVTMALPPLIRDGVVALVVIALLPSSSWHHFPHPNCVIVIIDDIALIICWQAGIAAVDLQVYLPVSRWQMLLSSRWHHCRC